MILEQDDNHIKYHLLKDTPKISATFGSKLIVAKDVVNGWTFWKTRDNKSIKIYQNP